MKIAIYSREANPSIDPPMFYASRERFEMLLATGEVKRLSKRRAQMTCEQRDPAKVQKRPRDYADVSRVENGYSWQIVHQTKQGYGPGCPEFQMMK